MNLEYTELAKYYDIFNSKKDYQKEVDFLISILKNKNVKTVLDVGCGTGNHLVYLEKAGFNCIGMDNSPEMLSIARKKVKSELFLNDMTNFDLNKKFDAIICMYATFNHNLSIKNAEKTLVCFKNHLNKNGMILIDLHNPSSSGKKVEKVGDVERSISWNFDKNNKIENTEIQFKINGKTINAKHVFRIYSIKEISDLLSRVGFKKVIVYEGYGFNKANNKSKNLEIIGEI